MFLLSKVPQIFGTTLDDILGKLDKLSEEDVALMIANRAAFLVTVAPWEPLWVPPGCAMLEETSQGHLSFGCKIPICLLTADFLSAYNHYAQLCGAGQAKMQQVAGFLSEQIAMAQGDHRS